MLMKRCEESSYFYLMEGGLVRILCISEMKQVKFLVERGEQLCLSFPLSIQHLNFLKG